MIINQTTKYGLIFVGGLVLGALGVAAIAKSGKKFEGVKPLASSLLSAGIDAKDKVLASVEGVREDLADVLAEAQAKSQERREALEAKEAIDVKPKAKKSTVRAKKAKAKTAAA